MARFSRPFLDAVLERTDLVRLVGSRISLKKKGKDYWACCPFHQEKTASFSVSAEKQIYYCFGCHAHGNALSFLMSYDSLGFVEAVTILAEEAGIPLPEGEKEGGEDIGPLRNTLEQALRVYQQALHGSRECQDYWLSRGVPPEMWKHFSLGYAPPHGDLILQRLGQRPADREMLVACGVLGRSATGTLYERFRGRAVFAIRDGRGRLCGLAGRSIDGREPKYLNSPETLLYHKSQVLYGLDLARQGIRKHGRILLVEGYLDVISLHQAGLDCAVAASGTALGDGQMETLFRAAREVVLCFDGDGAGRKAAWRTIQLCPVHLRPGRLLRVLFLPEGEDPDSLVRQKGADAVGCLLDSATPALDFYLESLLEQFDTRRNDEMAQFLRVSREFLGKVEDADLREIYLQKVAAIAGVSSPAPQASGSKPPMPQKPSPRGSQVRTLYGRGLRLFLGRPDHPAWRDLERDMLALLKEESEEAVALQMALEILDNASHISTQALYAWLEMRPESARYFALAMEMERSPLPDFSADEAIVDCVRRMNSDLARARRQFIGRTADRAGISALSEEERQELLRLTRRSCQKGHTGS